MYLALALDVSLYLCPGLCLSLHTAICSFMFLCVSISQFLPTQLRGRTALGHYCTPYPKPTPGTYTVLSVSSGARVFSTSPPV